MQLDWVLIFMEKKQMNKSMQLVFGKRKGHPFSLLVFIAPISVLGCLGVVLPYPCPSFGLSWVGFYSSSPLGWADPTLIFVGFSVSLSIQKLKAKLCHCRFRNRYQKLWHCRFRNRQPKTVTLPIQKSAAKLCRCQLRNRHQRTVSLSI
jgi:hypothetical protein